MFPSGRWKGFWEQPGWGRQWMEGMTLRFFEGNVEGEGQDCVGRFIFAGTYSESGELSMIKQYLGRHCVMYHGHVEGEGTIVGQWSFGPFGGGPFALMPVIENVDDLPITRIVPQQD